MEPTSYRLVWGAEALDFSDLAELTAFAQEQGCEQVTYSPLWRTLSA